METRCKRRVSCGERLNLLAQGSSPRRLSDTIHYVKRLIVLKVATGRLGPSGSHICANLYVVRTALFQCKFRLA